MTPVVGMERHEGDTALRRPWRPSCHVRYNMLVRLVGTPGWRKINMAAQLGRYEIRKELGRGGMATVYLGYDPQFKREVAVKVLPPQFTHDPSFFSRFEQEAETIAGLEHTAIVPVYDYGREQDNPYFVMRLMAGDLRQAIQQRALPAPQVLAICQRICAALDKAHSWAWSSLKCSPGSSPSPARTPPPCYTNTPTNRPPPCAT